MNLSKNFTLAELTVSMTGARQGLSNVPDTVAIKHLQRLTTELLQPIRDLINLPIVVHSGYRSLAVNNAVGGSRTSAHMQGYAADITVPALGSARELANYLVKTLPAHGIKFDQIILEFGEWVHVGLCNQLGAQRGQILTAKKVAGKTEYFKGIVQ